MCFIRFGLLRPCREGSRGEVFEGGEKGGGMREGREMRGWWEMRGGWEMRDKRRVV